MHSNHETLGDIIKYYREKSDYTVEELANKIGITERYLYRIENEGKKPSFDVLYRIVRVLSISPDTIFYPESSKSSQKIGLISHLLYKCNENSLNVIEILVKELIVQSK